MKLSELERKEIKKIFYQDEFGEIGIEDESKEFHLIGYGNIYLELTDNSILEIVNDDEKEGITITKIENSYKKEFVNNEIKNDVFWSQISNKLILQIKTYKDSFLETIGNKTNQKEVISTIEIVFKNGERIFISNAGYVNKDKILGMTGDFMVYKKRKFGLRLNLINE